MSERLEPGRLVRWQHEGGWKVGHVLWVDATAGCSIVQCPEGIYSVDYYSTEPHPTRKERGEE